MADKHFNTFIKIYFQKNDISFNKQNFVLYGELFKGVELKHHAEKYKSFQTIIDNDFISEPNKVELISLFHINQKLFSCINKIAYVWKFNKAKYFDYNYDLNFDSLDDIKTNFKVTVFHDNTKYLFKIGDLINIIHSSILTCPDMFVQPTDIKNPYTNVPFTTATLYNIYVKLIKNKITPSILFSAFFKCGFDINKFVVLYEPMILDEYLKKYVMDLSKDRKFSIIFEMLRKYKTTNINMKQFYFKMFRIKTHINKDKFINKLTPMLKKYIFVKYSLNEYNKSVCQREIINELTKLTETTCDFTNNVKTHNKKPHFSQQIVFKSLQNLKFVENISKHKPQVFDTSEHLTEGIFVFSCDSDNFVFSRPNIRNKVSKEFIKKNKSNIKKAKLCRQLYNSRRKMLNLFNREHNINDSVFDEYVNYIYDYTNTTRITQSPHPSFRRQTQNSLNEFDSNYSAVLSTISSPGYWHRVISDGLNESRNIDEVTVQNLIRESTTQTDVFEEDDYDGDPEEEEEEEGEEEEEIIAQHPPLQTIINIESSIHESEISENEDSEDNSEGYDSY